MPLRPGSRLGDYEIVTQLGAGGMGTVYRARDLRLKRDVALKILSTSAPAGQAARDLLQEARHAARLNHPNVCTIYEVEETGATPFIAMEHVPGRPLSSVIASGGLPSEMAAAYGAQIAEAIAHAHEHGIIHRDIKSANVIVGPAGRVKVLDFGIACLAPSVAVDATTGIVMIGGEGAPGTLAYMAPEVLRGEAADQRSDVWSLGIVLYEMSAGRRPFQGATALEIASNILHGPIPPLPATVPPSLRAVIHRCLARSGDERYRHAGEIRAALETIADSSRLPPIEPVASVVPGAPRAGRRRVIWIAPALAAVFLGWWAVGQIRTRTRGVSLESQRPVAMFGGNYGQATFSPDGAFVAFVNTNAPVPQIWVKNLAEGDPIAITSGSVPASRPAWSPKNDQIVFAMRGQGLWSVPPLGGTPRRITEAGSNPRFSANGERLVFERGSREIWTVRPDGSEARRVEGVPSPWYSLGLAPALSPDGSEIVYILRELGPNGDLWIVPAAGGQPRRLTADLTEISDPIWTADGRFIIYSSLRGGSRVLWRVSTHGGAPEPLTVGSGDDIEPALSPDGHTLIYTNVRNDWQLVVIEAATGRQRTIVQRRTEVLWPRVSSDGSRIAFFARGPFGDPQIFTISFDGRNNQQLTRGRAQINTMPRWSPDGSRIYFYENRPTDTFRVIAASGGVSSEIAKWPWEQYTFAEPKPDDETTFVYRQQKGPGAPGRPDATVIHNLKTGAMRQLPRTLDGSRWSADGNWIAGEVDSPRRVVVCSADGSTCHDVAPGRAPVWTRDGRRILFLRDTEAPAMMDLWSVAPDGRDARKLAGPLGPFRAIDITFDVSPGNDVVFSKVQRSAPELWQAQLRY